MRPTHPKTATAAVKPNPRQYFHYLRLFHRLHPAWASLDAQILKNLLDRRLYPIFAKPRKKRT
jgi:hypothetical protein